MATDNLPKTLTAAQALTSSSTSGSGTKTNSIRELLPASWNHWKTIRVNYHTASIVKLLAMR
jgi:hypothetical protein